MSTETDQMIEDAARKMCAVCAAEWDAKDIDEYVNSRWLQWSGEARAALESLGLPLETLAALKAGTMKAVRVTAEFPAGCVAKEWRKSSATGKYES